MILIAAVNHNIPSHAFFLFGTPYVVSGERSTVKWRNGRRAGFLEFDTCGGRLSLVRACNEVLSKETACW